MVECSIDAVCTLLNNQYSRYFELEISDELFFVTKSARSHYIDAEEIMGMFSAAQGKSPHASIAYMSSKIRGKKNCSFYR